MAHPSPLLSLAHQINAHMDDYGWAETDDQRRTALFAWMADVTLAVTRLLESQEDDRAA